MQAKIKTAQSSIAAAVQMYKLGDYAEALMAVDLALSIYSSPDLATNPKLDDERANSFFHRGKILWARGESQDALSAFDQAIQIYESKHLSGNKQFALRHSQAILTRAEILNHKGNSILAQRAFMSGLLCLDTYPQENSTDATACKAELYAGLGVSYLKTGDYTSSYASLSLARDLLGSSLLRSDPDLNSVRTRVRVALQSIESRNETSRTHPKGQIESDVEHSKLNEYSGVVGDLDVRETGRSEIYTAKTSNRISQTPSFDFVAHWQSAPLREWMELLSIALLGCIVLLGLLWLLEELSGIPIFNILIILYSNLFVAMLIFPLLLFMTDPWVKLEQISLFPWPVTKLRPTDFLLRRANRGLADATQVVAKRQKKFSSLVNRITFFILSSLFLNVALIVVKGPFSSIGSSFLFLASQHFATFYGLILYLRILRRHSGGKFIIRSKYHSFIKQLSSPETGYYYNGDERRLVETSSSSGVAAMMFLPMLATMSSGCLARRPGLAVRNRVYRRPIFGMLWLIFSMALFQIMYLVAIVAISIFLNYGFS